MKPIELETLKIKEQHAMMWEMVELQVRKAFEAMENFDKNIANQIITREKMVNTQELVVDHSCENFIALYSPVAIDLRFVISLLKINNNLERIGDFAESIALFVNYRQKSKLPKELVDKLELKKMCTYALNMLTTARAALSKEDTTIAAQVLGMDAEVDRINAQAIPVLSQYMKANPESMEEMLALYGVIRRIERIGDRSANIAEDVVFYVDAKELRHNEK